MRMDTATIRYFDRVSHMLDKAGHGQKGRIIENAMAYMNLSRQQVYNELRRAGFRSGRRHRVDRGKTAVSDHELRALSAFINETVRKNGKRMLTFSDAIDIARANGMLTCALTASQISRQMRVKGLHPDQITRQRPHTDLRSLHPNHTWEFDVSVCVLYYLKDANGLCAMDEKEFYKNKPKNLEKIQNQRILRYLVTDHTSGAMYVEYFNVAGENEETLFRFLTNAMIRRDHERDPFHGVPFHLIWDAGSANQSHMIKNLLDALGVDHWAHTPGNPRAKGQVEGGHNLVERSFEARLRFMDVESMEALNDAAHVWMRGHNASARHRRTGRTRYGVWQTIREDQLRICPDRDVCRALLHTKPEKRLVRGNLTISYKIKGYDSYDYSVAHIPDIRINEKVRVTVNPYQAPCVFVIRETENGKVHYECEPLEKDQYGFYQDAPVIREEFRAPKDADVDQNRKDLTKRAYAADTLEEAEKKKKKNTPIFGGNVDPITYMEERSAVFMNRKGRKITINDPARMEVLPMSVVDAARRLKENLGESYTPDLYREMKERWPDGISTDELAAFEVEIEGRARRAGLRMLG